MPYQARKEIETSDFCRAHASEQGYVRKMRERGMIIDIDNVSVDVREMIKRRFVCDTFLCVERAKRDGKRFYEGSCCTDLTVHLSPYEAEKIRDLFERAADRRDQFPSGVRKAMDRVLADDFTHENDEYELCLDDQETNACSLSFINPGNNAYYCAVDAICIKLGLDVGEFKAIPCIDFPIHVSEYEPERYLLTIMAPANYRLLGGSKEQVDVACIKKPPKDAPPAYQSLKRTIVNRFGIEFFAKLDKAAQAFLT